MAKLENTFKKYLVRIMGTRWDVQSHEDALSIGIPDLSFGINKAMDVDITPINGWIELKQIESWPVLVTRTMARPKKYTVNQVNWLLKRGRFGGHCFVMVKIVATEEYFIFRYRMATEIKLGMLQSQYYERCLGYWKGSINPDELAYTLTIK